MLHPEAYKRQDDVSTIKRQDDASTIKRQDDVSTFAILLLELLRFATKSKGGLFGVNAAMDVHTCL